MSVKLPHETLLSSISSLTKETNSEARIKIITSIAENVKASQDQFSPEADATNLDACLSADACYVLKRLIKGSASLKENVRESFFLGLSSILAVLKTSLPLPILMSAALQILSPQELFGSSKASRGEDSAVRAAKLNLYSIFLQEYPEQIEALSQESKDLILKDVFEISQARTFFGFPAATLLLSLYKQYPFYREPILKSCETAEANLDIIWLLASIGPASKGSYPASLTAFDDVLDAEELILKMLDESISFLSAPHNLWFKLLEHRMGKPDFAAFWSKIVDEALLGSESVQKKLVGLELAKWLLKAQAFPFPSDNLFAVIDRIGAHSLRKKQQSLPLNRSVSQLLSLANGLPSGHPFLEKLSELKHFRFFPQETISAVLANPATLDKYLVGITSRIGQEDAAAIEALGDLVNKRLVSQSQATELFKKCLECYLTATQEIRSQMLPRLQSLIGSCWKIHGFNIFTPLMLEDGVWTTVDDEIILDSKASIEKALKKYSKRKVKGDEQVVPQVLQDLLGFCLLWLLLDPLIVAESVEDLVELIGETSKGKKSLEDLNAVPIIVDFLLKLLSGSHSCLKLLADHYFKLLVPFCKQDALQLALDVIMSESSSMEVEDDEEEEEEDEDEEEVEFECSESEESDDEDVPTNLGKRVREEASDEESSAESIVLLDDADAAELEMYDKKLSEIFKHKKTAKLQAKLDKQASIHFKARLVQWIRFCLDSSEGIQDVVLKAEFLKDLLMAMSHGLANSESLGVAQSLLDTLKSSLRGQPKQLAQEPALILQVFSSIEGSLLDEYADNQLQWTASFVVLGYLLKLLPQESRSPTIEGHLKTCWNSVVSAKKLQKGRFMQYFSLWTDMSASSCLSFIVASHLVVEMQQVNSHCRSLCLEFIHSSVKKSQEHSQLVPLFEQIVSFFDAQNKPSNDKQVNEASMILITIKKKLGKSFPKELLPKIKPVAEELDASRRKNLESAFKL